MAGYFIDKNGAQRAWYVGGARQYPHLEVLMSIECVQADGDELQLILEKCPSVPVALELNTPLRVQRWFGDTAKFIANAIWR